MSSLPRSRLPAPGSRLPAPTPVGKRPRGASVDLEESEFKRKKMEKAGDSSSSLPDTTAGAKKVAGVGRMAAPPGRLPKSMMSGRATTVGVRSTAATSVSAARRATTATRTTGPAAARSAMNDRTNVATRPAANTANAANAGQTKKRAAWDTKGRLEDMERHLKVTNERLVSLESQNTQLKSNVVEKETVVIQNSEELKNVRNEKDTLETEVSKLKKDLSEMTEKCDDEAKKFKRAIGDLEFDKSSLERKAKSLEDELSSKLEEISGLKSTVSQLTSASAGIEAELKTTKLTLEKAQEENTRLNKLSSEQAAAIEVYEEKERAFETERRRLHNTIQELKGNIRVFCRVRPLLGEEAADGNAIKHIEFDDADDKSLALTRQPDSPTEHSVAGGLKGKASKYDFQFDKVFGPSTSQPQVFDEISQLVQSAIDGYNVCVFAYGQTGSGKTFTMEGGEDEGQEGMIPRTIEQIFMETRRLKENGWTYLLQASFLEIYNEEIRDLLATEKNLKYDIKMTSDTKKDGSVQVTNLKIKTVETASEIRNILRLAHKNRAVAATNCNERSSRSHSVFQLRITGENSLTSESCSGMLNLVDLAGSERLKDSGSEGVRLTETKNINKSLANLGNVIMALAQKDQHIPYRNSKLTHLLQGSLGGNSKTLMFVNVSPKEECFAESLNSLRFATKVNQCQIGTATKKLK